MADREEDGLIAAVGVRRSNPFYMGRIEVDAGTPLGRGSDAVVYKFLWHGIGTAAKVIHAILVEYGNDGREVQLRNFGEEIERLTRLHHPNVCQIIGVAVCRLHGALLPVLVVELLDKTLEACSVGVGRENDTHLMGYLADTAAGIRYLHAQSIIHRDLAPKNVMVGGLRAKVCDFGLAKFIRPELGNVLLRATTCPGTMPYMAPEALVQHASYGKPLDVFSFGVLAVVVLSGQHPTFDINAPRAEIIESPPGTRTNVVIPEVTRRREDLNRIPDDHPLKAIIMRCLSDRPDDRPTSANLHEELKRVQTQLSAAIPARSGAVSAVPADMHAAIGEVRSSVVEVQTAVAQQQRAMERVQSTLENQQQQITAQLQRMSQQQQRVTEQQQGTLEQQQRTLEQQQRTLEQQQQQLQSMSQQQQRSTEDQQRGISELQDAVATQAGRMADLSVAVTGLQDAVATQAGRMADQAGRMADLSVAVTGLQARQSPSRGPSTQTTREREYRFQVSRNEKVTIQREGSVASIEVSDWAWAWEVNWAALAVPLTDFESGNDLTIQADETPSKCDIKIQFSGNDELTIRKIKQGDTFGFTCQEDRVKARHNSVVISSSIRKPTDASAPVKMAMFPEQLGMHTFRIL